MAAPANPESVVTHDAPQLELGTGAFDEIGAAGAVGCTEGGILTRSLSLW